MKLGAFWLARSMPICVRVIDRSGGELWYRVEAKKIETLDTTEHWQGWINSAHLMEHGVRLSY